MEENFVQQVSNVRNQISKVFSNPSSPVSIPSSFGSQKYLRSSILKIAAKEVTRYPKPKEYLSLPNISVHRNPMSFVSERDVGRQVSMNRKKNISKGLLVYSLPVSSNDDEKDWDKVISTCSELIKNKCATGL